MRPSTLRLLVVLGAIACFASQVFADTRSVSYSTWAISPEMTILRFVVPVSDAERLTNARMPLLTTIKLQDYLLRHLSVTASGTSCPAIDQGWDIGKVDPLSVGPGLYGFEIFFRCPTKATTGLVLKNTALFDVIPGHVNFARIETAGGVVEQLFTTGQQEVVVPKTGPVRNASPGSYLTLGFLHLWHSVDRVCVLLGALLLLWRRGRAASLVLGLAAGYGLSIVVAASGWVAPRMVLIDAFIGLLVAIIAAEILAREGGRFRVAAAGVVSLLLLAIVMMFVRGPFPAMMLGGAALAVGGFLASPPAESDRSPLRIAALVALLGFLDGFVLPVELVPMSLSARTVVPMAIGYDLGAVLGAVVLFLLVTGAWFLLRRIRFEIPVSLLDDLAATAFGGLGVFWLVSRLHG